MSKSVLKVAKKIPKSEANENHEVGKKEKSKIPVTFNAEQLALIENYKGILGNTKAEIIRNIVIKWILNNSSNGGKKQNEK